MKHASSAGRKKTSTHDKSSAIHTDDLSNILNDELVQIFGAPNIISGESFEDYQELEYQLRLQFKPKDILDEILLRDIIDAIWELLRLKRIKAHILNSSKIRAFGALKQERFGLTNKTPEIEGKTYAEALEYMGYKPTALLAKGFTINLENLTVIENQIYRLEIRRNNAIRDLELRQAAREKKRISYQDLEFKTAGVSK